MPKDTSMIPRTDADGTQKEEISDNGMLKLDMHIHSWYSTDSVIDPRSLVRLWNKKRILPLVCDHNTIAGAEVVYREISRGSPDIQVILAEEIMTREGEIIGLFLNEEIPSSLSAAETLDQIQEQGALSLIPHPFCSYRSSAIRRDTLQEIIGRVDIIEGYNARVLSDEENRMAREFAAEQKKLISAGSDAHTTLELGRCFMELSQFTGTKEFLAVLKEAPVRFRLMHPSVHYLTKVVKMTKRNGFFRE
jgi:predicted metal-dependent phosphoesterase TrpH